jgi:hypothetical protein
LLYVRSFFFVFKRWLVTCSKRTLSKKTSFFAMKSLITFNFTSTFNYCWKLKILLKCDLFLLFTYLFYENITQY